MGFAVLADSDSHDDDFEDEDCEIAGWGYNECKYNPLMTFEFFAKLLQYLPSHEAVSRMSFIIIYNNITTYTSDRNTCTD